MIVFLTYRRDPRNIPPGHSYRDPLHTTEWCVPTGWSDACIIRDFERQYPGTVVVSLAPKAEVAAA